MFVLKSLGRLILGNTEQDDLLAIPGGKLLVNVDGKKQEEYFASAKLVLQRGSKPFEYNLIVVDEALEEPKETFSIAPALAFTKSATDFEWKTGELKFHFAFSQETMATTIEMFQITMAQCLYEVDKKKSHLTASEADLKKYILTVKPVAEKPKVDDEEVLFKSEEAAGWYQFDPETGLFTPKGTDCCTFITRSSKKHFYLLVQSSEAEELHRQLVDPDATHHTDRSSSSYIWCYLDPSVMIHTYSLRFQSPAAVMALSNAIGHAIYEILNAEKMSAEDSKYLLNPFCGQEIEMQEAPPLEILSESDGESDDKEEHMEEMETEGKFTNLAVGYKHDRSFVSRGSSLGVFRHTDDDRLEHYTTIADGFTTNKGFKFAPSTMMLHQEDSSLLVMNPEDQKRIYKMDLTVGKVVEEWGVADEVSVTSILPSAKYSQMTNDPTLIGLNDSSLFRLDPRLSGINKRVDAETKAYVVKNKFSCGATTGKGELAVASAKGDIRLFNKLDKRAKTLLPGFGDAILGIDVTESGRWIIATCKNYLLLVNVEIDQQQLGFTKNMPEKPKPIRLQLKPEHVAYMGSPVSFTPARFSTGATEEKAIITSTGPFVISWNFRRVKQGHFFDYQLKRYGDNVVAENFRYGQDRSMIVTLPNHVTMMSKKSLSCPSPRVFRGAVVKEYDK